VLLCQLLALRKLSLHTQQLSDLVRIRPLHNDSDILQPSSKQGYIDRTPRTTQGKSRRHPALSCGRYQGIEEMLEIVDLFLILLVPLSPPVDVSQLQARHIGVGN